jgi:hypothetical protein
MTVKMLRGELACGFHTKQIKIPFGSTTFLEIPQILQLPKPKEPPKLLSGQELPSTIFTHTKS